MKSLFQNSDNSLTLDMIRIWPAKSNECKFFPVFYLNKIDFGIVVDNSSVPCVIFFFLVFFSCFSLKSFFNLLGFRLNAKTFYIVLRTFLISESSDIIACFPVESKIVFFRASSILLTQLSISECKKLIFHAEHSRGCIGYTTSRTIPNMTCASLVWWGLKMKDKAVEKGS